MHTDWEEELDRYRTTKNTWDEIYIKAFKGGELN